MIVATFNLHDQEPRVLRTAPWRCRWLVKLWVQGIDTQGHELRSEQQLRTGRCYLTEVLPMASGAIDEILADLTEMHDGGFQVIRLR